MALLVLGRMFAHRGRPTEGGRGKAGRKEEREAGGREELLLIPMQEEVLFYELCFRGVCVLDPNVKCISHYRSNKII